MDVLLSSDYLIDLGPEGGERGGQGIAAGTPEEVAKCKVGYTGAYLKDYMKELKRAGKWK
jgi:excinuclease ABC subunit A